jgi:ketosteroid isomerase-like protein
MSRLLPKRLAAILSAMMLAAVPLQIHAQPLKAPHEHKHLEREQVEALEMQWRHAQLAEDVSTMDKLLSDDYLGITASGEVVTKNQQLDHMRTRRLVIDKLDISDLKIKLIGPIAIVTSLAQIDGTSDGAPLTGSFRYTRVYQRLPSGVWKITNFEATRIHARREAPPPGQSADQPPVAPPAQR